MLTEIQAEGKEIKSDSYHEEPFLCMQPYTQLVISCWTTINQNHLVLLFFGTGPITLVSV